MKIFQKNHFVLCIIAFITQVCTDQVPIIISQIKKNRVNYRKDGYDILQRMAASKWYRKKLRAKMGFGGSEKIGFDWVWIGFAFFVGLGVKIVVSTSFASSCSDSRIQEIGFASQKKLF